MFIGHYAPALIAAAYQQAPRLGVLFVAAQLVDLAFFGFVLLDIEHLRAVPGTTVMNAMDLYDMPYTHSLLGSIAFAAAWAFVARVTRHGWPAAAIGAGVVLSHWFLDLLVHAPDLTLAGDGERYGLGLWNHPVIEMPLETAITAGAFAYYLTRTSSRTMAGRVSPLTLALALAAVQAINWLEPQPATTVDPVPMSQPLTALTAYVVLALLATWVARTRTPRVGPRVRTL
ncbi:hypothetical protein [Sphingomonas radiodurans]|uniref:hypothetical protein n=1 Tax=Sphingomonas radiodurans TaxID=2890321 RepID=UPI001E5FA0B4|nr:hypothetical protein [Sphingomonas radiodurans]WBH16335.1 hypothetical protein LLW23_16300 [Sphingomonas radiodurans]